jgi:hypothetical protein
MVNSTTPKPLKNGEIITNKTERVYPNAAVVNEGGRPSA